MRSASAGFPARPPISRSDPAASMSTAFRSRPSPRMARPTINQPFFPPQLARFPPPRFRQRAMPSSISTSGIAKSPISRIRSCSMTRSAAPTRRRGGRPSGRFASTRCRARPAACRSASRRRPGRLTSRAIAPPAPDDPCILPPASGYRGLENRLYRIEIHNGGALGTARFKWSRDNGSIVSAVRDIAVSGTQTTLTVNRIGRDQFLRFRVGDWVTVTDDHRELTGEPGEMALIVDIDETNRQIVLDRALPAPGQRPFGANAGADRRAAHARAEMGSDGRHQHRRRRRPHSHRRGADPDRRWHRDRVLDRSRGRLVPRRRLLGVLGAHGDGANRGAHRCATARHRSPLYAARRDHRARRRRSPRSPTAGRRRNSAAIAAAPSSCVPERTSRPASMPCRRRAAVCASRPDCMLIREPLRIAPWQHRAQGGESGNDRAIARQRASPDHRQSGGLPDRGHRRAGHRLRGEFHRRRRRWCDQRSPPPRACASPIAA